jgi:hypothetical protein
MPLAFSQALRRTIYCVSPSLRVAMAMRQNATKGENGVDRNLERTVSILVIDASQSRQFSNLC